MPIRRVVELVRWYRRPIAAALAVVALVLAVHAAAPSPPASVDVVVAARDLDAGVALSAGDLRLTRVVASAVPTRALRRMPTTSRVVALPIRAGEVLTDVRLVDDAQLEALGPDLVAAPVRLADAPPDSLVQVGSTVDVIAAGETGDTRVVARAVRVLVAPRPPSRTALRADGDGAQLVVAVTVDDAVELARAAAVARLSLAVRSGSTG